LLDISPHTGGSATVHALILKALLARGHSIRAIAPIASVNGATRDWFTTANPALHIQRFEVPSSYRLRLQPILSSWKRSVSLLHVSSVANAPNRSPTLCCSATSSSCTPGRRWAQPVVHGGALYLLRRGSEPTRELADFFDCYRRADHLVAVAPYQGPYLDQLGLTRYSIIPNTTDTQQFKPREKNRALLAQLGIAADDFVVADFSNLRSVKRPLDFVEAAAIALRRDPRLLFIASGSGELRDAVESGCAQLAIAGRFGFPGWIRGDCMPDYYSICDAVAMPSESEGRSMVHLETQSSGRVLITSDIPASREVVRDGVTGMLFPLGSPEALAECIVAAAADDVLRETIGRQTRSAVENHSLDAYGVSMERMLMQLVERSRYGVDHSAADRPRGDG
jgi:glycosyltransferase involved in cell wall biosynthesis